MAKLDQPLHAVLASLEECRAVLIDHNDLETALLLSVAILELKMKLNQISASELKALCDAMVPDDAPAERTHLARAALGQRRRPLLKLVE